MKNRGLSFTPRKMGKMEEQNINIVPIYETPFKITRIENGFHIEIVGEIKDEIKNIMFTRDKYGILHAVDVENIAYIEEV